VTCAQDEDCHNEDTEKTLNVRSNLLEANTQKSACGEYHKTHESYILLYICHSFIILFVIELCI